MLPLFVGISFSIFVLQKHDIKSSPARCIDGSPAALYYQLGSNQNKNKIVVYFQGGGTCANGNLNQTFKQCYARSKTDLGSSKNYPINKTFRGYGILSPDSSQNPSMFDWTRVYVTYCDGAVYQGSRNQSVRFNNTDLYFRGYYNNIAHLQFLNTSLGLYQAQTIVITGVSAGGLATFFWSNFVYERAVNKNQVFSVADSGVFQLQYINPFTKRAQLKQQIFPFMEFMLQETPLTIEQCNGKGIQFAISCINAVNIIPYLKTKLLVIQSTYDHFCLGVILKLTCMGKQPGTLNNCNPQQTKAIEDYRISSLNSLNKFRESGHSVWSPSCIQHGFEQKGSFNSNNYKVPYNSGLKVSQAVIQFLNGRRVNLIDLQPWPQNRGCSGLSISKTTK